MPGSVGEVLVRRQKRHVVSYAELRQHSIHRTDLHTRTTAVIANCRSGNMIVPVGQDLLERGEPRQDLRM